MEPEGSLPHSQASTTRPYPGLAQSSPHATTHLLKILDAKNYLIKLMKGLEIKDEALDLTVWWTGYGPVVRQETDE